MDLKYEKHFNIVCSDNKFNTKKGIRKIQNFFFKFFNIYQQEEKTKNLKIKDKSILLTIKESALK